MALLALFCLNGFIFFSWYIYLGMTDFGKAISSRLVMLRSKDSRLLTGAMLVNMTVFFGPINISSYLLKTDIQDSYPWVINRSQMFAATCLSICALLLVICTVEIFMRLSDSTGSLSEGDGDGPFKLFYIDRIVSYQILFLAACLLAVALRAGPLIGNAESNNGAWISAFTPLFQPFAISVYSVEAAPLIMCLFARESGGREQGKPALKVIIFAAQLITFILMKQRLLSIVGIIAIVIHYRSVLFRSYKNALFSFVGLLGAYTIPTALRYSRVGMRPDQELIEFIWQSISSFSAGLSPSRLFASFVNDISYSKAAIASLSVVYSLVSESASSCVDKTLGCFSWLWFQFLAALPGFIRESFTFPHVHNGEQWVSRAMGIGLDAVTPIEGVSPELWEGWIVDLVDSPFLDPLALGGILGVFIFCTLGTLIICALWKVVFGLFTRFQCMWIVACSLISSIALHGAWIKESLVALKGAFPWVVVCVAASQAIKLVGDRHLKSNH